MPFPVVGTEKIELNYIWFLPHGIYCLIKTS